MLNNLSQLTDAFTCIPDRSGDRARTLDLIHTFVPFSYTYLNSPSFWLVGPLPYYLFHQTCWSKPAAYFKTLILPLESSQLKPYSRNPGHLYLECLMTYFWSLVVSSLFLQCPSRYEYFLRTYPNPANQNLSKGSATHVSVLFAWNDHHFVAVVVRLLAPDHRFVQTNDTYSHRTNRPRQCQTLGLIWADISVPCQSNFPNFMSFSFSFHLRSLWCFCLWTTWESRSFCFRFVQNANLGNYPADPCISTNSVFTLPSRTRNIR